MLTLLEEPDVRWRKSTRSKDANTCVEVACNIAAGVGVRDSTDPHGPKLLFDRGAFGALLGAIRSGAHDL
ncbi:DUF397 domain-containing protein [Actinomadura sp. WAC 06369]|uniref:DUF397 domain-containing protein n=1 Tax=Actinomadura sp. WAC 06369 TaxID=2203193 RepID=UPI000F7B1311|nr:DUF397 domain-containing protein [Actinomadura sp. WAC 06369]RSN64817.1 DUF397 domain-containing protein [Actinomadura sp. WAC 06369]